MERFLKSFFSILGKLLIAKEQPGQPEKSPLQKALSFFLRGMAIVIVLAALTWLAFYGADYLMTKRLDGTKFDNWLHSFSGSSLYGVGMLFAVVTFLFFWGILAGAIIIREKDNRTQVAIGVIFIILAIPCVYIIGESLDFYFYYHYYHYISIPGGLPTRFPYLIH
jgi:hypothetical protein